MTTLLKGDMMNIIKFIRNIGNPHGMEWRKIGFLNLWALDDWNLYAGTGLHWSTSDRTLILAWDFGPGKFKTKTLLRLKPARA
jgi:hypothetical protein